MLNFVRRSYRCDRHAELPAEMPGSEPSPEAGNARGQLASRAIRAVASLPGRARRIIELTYFEDLTQRQVADETGISQVTVHRELRRALPEIRRSIEMALAA